MSQTRDMDGVQCKYISTSRGVDVVKNDVVIQCKYRPTSGDVNVVINNMNVQCKYKPTTTSSSVTDVNVDRNDVVFPQESVWGWVVVCAAFVVHMIVHGVIYSFGILFISLEERFPQGSKSDIAWIPSLTAGSLYLIGPVGSGLISRYGCRHVVVGGAMVSAVGFVLSMFVPSLYYMYITLGVITGCGFGLVFLPTIVIVTQYFSTNRSLACGIALSGAGIGAFVFSPLLEYLLNVYSLNGTFLLLSGITLNCVTCGLVFRPLHRPRVSIDVLTDKYTDQQNYVQTHVENYSDPDIQSCSINDSAENYSDPDIQYCRINGSARNHDHDDNGDVADSKQDTDVSEPVNLLNSIKNKEVVDDGSDNKADEGTTERDREAQEDRDSSEEGGAVREKTKEGTRNTNDKETIDTRTEYSIKRYKKGEGDNIIIKLKESKRHTKRDNVREETREGCKQRHTKGEETISIKAKYNVKKGAGEDEAEYDYKEEHDKAADSIEIEISNPAFMTPRLKSICFESIDSFGGHHSSSFVQRYRQLLHHRVMAMFFISQFLFFFAFYLPFIYIPDKARGLGIAEQDAAWIVSATGLSSISGRIFLGYIADRDSVDRIFIFKVALVTAGVATSLGPLLDTLWLLMVYAVVYGVSTGIVLSLTSVVIVDFVGLSLLTDAMGLNNLFSGVGCLLGPPFAGMLYDRTGSYTAPFLVPGIGITLSGVLVMLSIWCSRKR